MVLWGETRANIVCFTESKHASAGHLIQHPFLKQRQLMPLALSLGTKVENAGTDHTACHLTTTLLNRMYFHTKITFEVSSGYGKSSSEGFVSAEVDCFSCWHQIFLSSSRYSLLLICMCIVGY